MEAINYPDAFAAGKIYTWKEVSRVHRIRNGIYHRDGRLISLLTDFGRINPCYPDHHGSTEDTIFYTGSGRRGDQKLDPANRALAAAVESGAAVPLFNKIGVNRWQFTGMWRVQAKEYVFDESLGRAVWRFLLRRAG